MKEFFIICFLCACLDGPSDNDYPLETVCQFARNLSVSGKKIVANHAAAKFLHFPQSEEPYCGGFDGVYNIFWRRAQGRPFPYPTDPILGIRK